MADRKNHKYLRKEIGPSGKPVYIYTNNNSTNNKQNSSLEQKVKLLKKAIGMAIKIKKRDFSNKKETAFRRDSKRAVSIGKQYLKKINIDVPINVASKKR